MAAPDDQPRLGPTQRRLLGLKDQKEIARIKAEAFKGVQVRRVFKTHRDALVQIRTDPYVIHDGVVQVEVYVENLIGLPLPVDNPYRFVNPFIEVPDGTTREEIDQDSGQRIQVDNMVEDPAAALEKMISLAVHHVIDQHTTDDEGKSKGKK